jgi:hypothetical protein
MRIVAFFAAAGLMLAAFISLAFAQVGPAPQSPSILLDIWSIVQPLVVLFVSIVGPVLVTWVGARLVAFLQVADEAKRKEIEQRVSQALHQSAANALKFAMAKLGVAMPTSLDIRSPIVLEAIDYVRSKNPDAVDAFGLDDGSLAEIIMSKVPDVMATIAVATAPARR